MLGDGEHLLLGQAAQSNAVFKRDHVGLRIDPVAAGFVGVGRGWAGMQPIKPTRGDAFAAERKEHRVEAQGLTLQFRPLAARDQEQKSERTSDEAEEDWGR